MGLLMIYVSHIHTHTLTHKVHPPGWFALEFGGLTSFTQAITHLSTKGTAGER